MAFSMKEITCTENPQELNYTEDALDKVVDPCTEFQHNSGIKSPNASFNFPAPAPSKYSFVSLRGKLNYKVNDHELPRVHKTLSTKSVTNMWKGNFRRNFSESSGCNGSDKTDSSISHAAYSCDSASDSASVRRLSDDVCITIYEDEPEVSPSALQSLNYQQDQLETASVASNLTDTQGSNVSSVSDLTGCEEEFCQVKNLLSNGSRHSLYRTDYANATNINNSNDFPINQRRIEELETILQKTRTENEQYKFKLKDLENETELIWQEKFQELLRQKANCEGQLQVVSTQYETALSEKDKIINAFKHSGGDKSVLHAEFTKLQVKLSNFEKCNSELNSKLALSLNETKQWHLEFTKTESENEKLRITLQEMKSEIDSKSSVLFGLKNKITEQHMELQNCIQAKLKLNNHITSLNNEIGAIKKSEKWYIDQLHTCQLAKSNIQQELMSTQTNLITASQKIENTKIEEAYWKNICEETQKKAMREKEKLLRNVERIEADILERNAILKCTQDETETKIKLNFVVKTVDDKHDYNIRIQDYEEELANLKSIIQDQNISIDNKNEQNTDYLVRLTTLQKKLNEKEINTQTMENRNRDLEMKCNAQSENLRTKDNELLELRNKIVNLEVTLHAANREKQEVDEVVKNVREDFNKFMKCYQNMKEKLDVKSKLITQCEHEKQELFMENNWRVCEIEDLQRKVLDVKSLQAEITELKNMENYLLMEKDHLLNENCDFRLKNQELETDCDNLKLKLTTLQDEYSTLQQEDIVRDKSNLEKKVENLNETLKVLEDYCEYLNNEVNEKDKIINGLKQLLTEKCEEIEQYTLDAKLRLLNADPELGSVKSNNDTLLTWDDEMVRTPVRYNKKVESNGNSANVGIQTHAEVKCDQVTSLMQEVKDLKILLHVTEVERKEQCKRFETNNRTLLRNVKEHMRDKKAAETKLSSLQDNYTSVLTDVNDLKVLNSRHEIELVTFKVRCEEYKVKCDKLHEAIIDLERQKGQTAYKQSDRECLNCLDKDNIVRECKEIAYKYSSLEEKICWYEKEITDKEQGITECKKQLFNEKLQCSALKKQLSSVQMCLDNANEQLDGKQVEFRQLKSMIEKLETNEQLLTDQLENVHTQYQECKRKLETTTRMVVEKTAKDEILADEIKTLSCHLHQKSLELLNVQNTVMLLQTQSVTKDNKYKKTIDDLQTSLAEIQCELESVQNDKFFLQRLCADLKMSLQGTLNQNKVLKLRLESLEFETKDLNEKLKYDSLPSVPSPSKLDEEYINRLLQQSIVLPEKPLNNLRSCLDSLKDEMATLQKEIIAKTQSDISL